MPHGRAKPRGGLAIFYVGEDDVLVNYFAELHVALPLRPKQHP